jgi:peptide deformylase
MALLTILSYPDPRLHTVAKPVDVVDDRIRTLAADMLETMYDSKGVGLAATQIDVHERVVVMDVSEDRNQPLVMINPELLWKSEERIKGEEGCLSVPGIYDSVERAAQVKIQALDEHGQMQTYRSRWLDGGVYST